jgi:hypothetical protein
LLGKGLHAQGTRQKKGVWGGKVQGKTFQVTLAFTAMKVEPIIMSAGDLEVGQSGEPKKSYMHTAHKAPSIVSHPA